MRSHWLCTQKVSSMRTTDERIERLHARAQEIEKRSEKRKMAGFGSLSAAFAVLLIAILTQVGSLSPISDGQLTGSSLLSDGTGGYVIAAVVAFFIGVALTTAIFRLRRH